MLKNSGVENYDEYWKDRIQKKHFKCMRVHRCIVDTAVNLLGNTPARVLDCGVGPGHVYQMLSEHFDTHGIEISQEAINLYPFDTKNILKWNLNDGLPSFDPKMDLIIASRIIHHLKDPLAFLEHIKRQLSPNGYFIAVIPNLCYYTHRLELLKGNLPPFSHAHINFQSGQGFQKMVESNGFTFRKLITPKKFPHVKLWPTLFSRDLIYVFKKSE